MTTVFDHFIIEYALYNEKLSIQKYMVYTIIDNKNTCQDDNKPCSYHQTCNKKVAICTEWLHNLYVICKYMYSVYLTFCNKLSPPQNNGISNNIKFSIVKHRNKTLKECLNMQINLVSILKWLPKAKQSTFLICKTTNKRIKAVLQNLIPQL